MDHGITLSDSWDFFKDNLKASMAFMLPLILLITIVGDFIVALLPLTDSVVTTNTSWFMVGIAFLLKANLFGIAVSLYLYFMKNIIYATGFSGVEIVKNTLPKLPNILIMTSIASLIIYISLFALIVPGLYVALRFSYAWFYLVFEDLSPVMALKKSVLETKDELLYIAKLLAIVFVPMLLLLFILFLFLTLAFDGAMLGLITSIIMVMVFIFMQIMMYRIYVECGNDLTPESKPTPTKVSL